MLTLSLRVGLLHFRYFRSRRSGSHDPLRSFLSPSLLRKYLAHQRD